MATTHANLVGQRFGKLTVMHMDGAENHGVNTLYICNCDCGKLKIVRAANLLSGATQSCGCLRGRPRKYADGQVFNGKALIGREGNKYVLKCVKCGHITKSNCPLKLTGPCKCTTQTYDKIFTNLTKDDLAKMATLLESGMCKANVAKEMNIGEHTVEKCINTYKMPYKDRRVLTSDKLENVKRYIEDGLSMTQIAKRLGGICVSAVSRYIKAHGLEYAHKYAWRGRPGVFSRVDGKRFGMLTVVGKSSKRTQTGGVFVECKCDCGETVVTRAACLLNGSKTHCGCRRKRIIDLEMRERIQKMLDQGKSIASVGRAVHISPALIYIEIKKFKTITPHQWSHVSEQKRREMRAKPVSVKRKELVQDDGMRPCGKNSAR